MFSRQYLDIKKIMSRHWKVLKNDRVLGPAITDFPKVIFRGVPPLKLQVAPNVLEALNRVSFFQRLKGFFPCRRCSVCHLNKNQGKRISQFQSTATSRYYEIDTFITCTSLNVVYLLICPCHLQYVGLTTRAMNV